MVAVIRPDDARAAQYQGHQELLTLSPLCEAGRIGKIRP